MVEEKVIIDYLQRKASEAVPGSQVVYVPGLGRTLVSPECVVMFDTLDKPMKELLTTLAHELGHCIAPLEYKYYQAPTESLAHFLRELEAGVAGKEFAIRWGILPTFKRISGVNIIYAITLLHPKSFLLLPTILKPYQVRELLPFLSPTTLAEAILTYPRAKALREKGAERICQLLRDIPRW